MVRCNENLENSFKCGEKKLTRFEDLNNDGLVVLRVDSFVDFGVLASSDLLDDLVVVLRLELNFKVVIVCIVGHLLGHLGAHVRVILGSGHLFFSFSLYLPCDIIYLCLDCSMTHSLTRSVNEYACFALFCSVLLL